MAAVTMDDFDEEEMAELAKFQRRRRQELKRHPDPRDPDHEQEEE